MLASVASCENPTQHPLAVPSRLEVVSLEVGGGIDVPSNLSALLGTTVRERIRAFVRIDAHVRRHPFDADGDGEVAEEEAQRACESGMSFGFPTFGQNSNTELAVGVDEEALVGTRPSLNASLRNLHCHAEGPQLPQISGAVTQRR